ncbi:MAG: hypothetical protein Kow0059_05460 [Candidatus Sumerlaeia bacterium]
MSVAGARSFGLAVVRWFRANGDAAWPWRGPFPRDPYRVWISEVMLQQTTLKAAAPRFERWMRRFPDVAALARADPAAVVREWEGLGYYARARNLHRAARVIMTQQGGRIPDDERALCALPGIGPYTAAAILSLAFGRPVPVLDANVRRVVRRVLGMAEWNRAAEKELLAFLRAAMPRRDASAPGAFNEGLMELGQKLCRPADPLCGCCPLARRCAARAAGIQNQIPPRRSASPIRRQTTLLALVDERRRLLIVRRAAGLLKDLWVLPGLPVRSGRPPGADPSPAAEVSSSAAAGGETGDPAAWIRARAACIAVRLGALPARTHSYTRFSERLRPEVWLVRRPRSRPMPGARWVSLTALGRYPVPSVYRRILNDLADFLENQSRRPGLFDQG